MTMSRTAEWFWILITFLVLNLTYASTQPINNFHEGLAEHSLGTGAQVYYPTAKNAPRELPPQGMAPFVYRLGSPLLAAGLAKSRDRPIAAGFDRLNIAFNALSVVLLALLLHATSPMCSRVYS